MYLDYFDKFKGMSPYLAIDKAKFAEPMWIFKKA